MEISGDGWSDFGFKSFRSLDWPEYDICETRLRQRYDLIIAEQVFEHIENPYRAARNVRAMLRPGGMFLITLPFLIRYHPAPGDYRRWTASGLRLFLLQAGFMDVETDSWGNKPCLIANLERWVDYEPGVHDLRNDPRFPVSVWGTARRPTLGRTARSRAAQLRQTVRSGASKVRR